ncbi:MAG: DUF5012 domain-containing protein [Prevotellaceae bacterium]|nr:DUF5012 domain-containing protein [Prevotellaceae bacterium]
MKRNKYCLAFLSVFLLFGCEKETENVSRVTYYCELSLEGNPVELVGLGEAYSEPGWKASENGVDVSDAVTVSGSVNTNEAGLYRLTYSVNNEDGYPKVATRQVVVCNTTPSPLESGLYTVSKSSNRNGTTVYGQDFTILIYQVSPGEFYVSDLFGGYYDQRAGYGSDYAMVGYITLESDNSLALGENGVKGWGDSLDGLSNGAYDPATKTISWTASYAGTYNFNVTATKQ